MTSVSVRRSNSFNHMGSFPSTWSTIAENSINTNFSPFNNVVKTRETEVEGDLPVSNPDLTASAGPFFHNNAVGNHPLTSKTYSMTLKGVCCPFGGICLFIHPQ
nr:hypothetical protein HmN_000658900 [Hymenolepis microstoma]